jgi:hypothetical protein
MPMIAGNYETPIVEMFVKLSVPENSGSAS